MASKGEHVHVLCPVCKMTKVCVDLSSDGPPPEHWTVDDVETGCECQEFVGRDKYDEALLDEVAL